MDLPKALRMAAAAANLDRSTLALRAGITRMALWKISAGRASPRLSTLERIAAACGVPLSRLISWAEEE